MLAKFYEILFIHNNNKLSIRKLKIVGFFFIIYLIFLCGMEWLTKESKIIQYKFEGMKILVEFLKLFVVEKKTFFYGVYARRIISIVHIIVHNDSF